MGTTAHIQIKVDGTGFGENGLVAGTQLNVYGRIFDPHTQTALTDWVPIPCTQVVVRCNSPHDFVTADLTIRPSSVTALAGILENVELDRIDAKWLTEQGEMRRAVREQVSD